MNDFLPVHCLFFPPVHCLFFPHSPSVAILLLLFFKILLFISFDFDTFFVVVVVVDENTGSSKQSAGACVQARTGRHLQGHSEHRVRQHRQGPKPDRIRAIRWDHRHKTGEWLYISNLSQKSFDIWLRTLRCRSENLEIFSVSLTYIQAHLHSLLLSYSPLRSCSFPPLSISVKVVIGGKNKYMINGRTADTSRVQNLFHSVQLNVNNPHFLIMQGRITKVLNMKPAEVKYIPSLSHLTTSYHIISLKLEALVPFTF